MSGKSDATRHIEEQVENGKAELARSRLLLEILRVKAKHVKQDDLRQSMLVDIAETEQKVEQAQRRLGSLMGLKGM